MNNQLLMKRFKDLLILMIVTQTAALADVHLASIFSDNMVLQRDSVVRFWGFAKAGEPIKIAPGWTDETYSVMAPSPGRWTIDVPTPSAGGPYSITIDGYNSQVFKNVLIGEVWLVSGQSNMEWTPRMDILNALAEIAASDYPDIRFFSIPHMTADSPQLHLIGEWEQSSPETMIDFSAIAYFFGRELHKELNVPIGLINSSWGGTPAEAWTPGPDVMNDPILSRIASGMKEVPWGPVSPGSLYNAMIAPIAPFKIQGVLWYQGEANVGHADTYDDLMETMITSWRREWGYDFPFYFAQIAPWTYGGYDQGAALRDAQRRTLRVPGTAMVVTSDTVDDITDIHPKNKQAVALRFARIALDDIYGKDLGIVHSPLFERATIEGNAVRVSFQNACNGLISTGEPVTHFEVCGSDGVFHPAVATIDGSTVIVHSPDVPKPTQVRFAWDDEAIPNLFNAEGLPASVFTSSIEE